MRLKAPGLAVLGALLVGCTTPPTLYSWGSYEELIYQSYSEPGALPAEAQIEAMEKDRQVALAANQRMAPGWHAHLGYLYYQTGKRDEAQRELQAEKASFPESATLVDRLLTNMKNQ